MQVEVDVKCMQTYFVGMATLVSEIYSCIQCNSFDVIHSIQIHIIIA